MLMKRALLVAFGLGLLSSVASAVTCSTSDSPQAEAASPVVIPCAQQVDFDSKITGRRYRILVARPLFSPPTSGYPALYVLDGSTAVQTSRQQFYAGHIRAAVVVGIGYPTDDPREILKLRMLDLTLPASTKALGLLRGLTEADIGGLDAFLNVIEKEIVPRVAAMAPIDSANVAVFGHSLGGLAVLRALFQRSTMFRTFIAASPSIYWSERAVLADEPAFARKVKAGTIAPQVLIEVGGEESYLYTRVPKSVLVPPSRHLTLEELNTLMRNARMVEGASRSTVEN